jgi:nucleotide-binding universal stress UspA family protein
MKSNSYLLALDGSVESRAAAYLAWNLAKKTGARIVAQHVINVRDTWQFLRPKSAGFIGSGPYMEAFQRVTEGLRSVAEALMASYQAQVEGQNINFATHIDEGDLVSEITKRAKEHDLLIMGHRKSTKTRELGDYSLCEELAGLCPCPMLLVTANCDHWKKICVIIENVKVDLRALEKLSEFGKKIGLSMKLHISSSIALAEVKALLNAMALCHEFKSWEIYMDGGKQDSPPVDELRVIMPISNSSADKGGKNLRLNIQELSESALLIWPQMVGSRVLSN